MPPRAVAFHRHDHQRCSTTAIEALRSACAAQGLRLTPVRARVLEILLESHQAQGAYDILGRLTAEGLGSQPPVVYRALDFLVSHGFAHRIERLNAFVACTRDHSDTDPAFLICRKCTRVAETDGPRAESAFGQDARAAGFEVERTVLEAEGLCPACKG